MFVVATEQIMKPNVIVFDLNPHFAAAFRIDAAEDLLAARAFPYGTAPQVFWTARGFLATCACPNVVHVFPDC
jgi:hypothetical protein